MNRVQETRMNRDQESRKQLGLGVINLNLYKRELDHCKRVKDDTRNYNNINQHKRINSDEDGRKKHGSGQDTWIKQNQEP